MSYGIITHYTLYVDYNNGMNFNTTSTDNMYTISPLRPYQTVSVRISASTSVDEGPQSVAVDFTSDEASKSTDIMYSYMEYALFILKLCSDSLQLYLECIKLGMCSKIITTVATIYNNL